MFQHYCVFLNCSARFCMLLPEQANQVLKIDSNTRSFTWRTPFNGYFTRKLEENQDMGME